MNKNERFQSEELYNPKRPRRHKVISPAQNHAKLRPRISPLNNDTHDTLSPMVSLKIQYSFILFNYLIFLLIFLFKMNAINKNIVIRFDIKNAPDFKNPFLKIYLFNILILY